MVHQQREEGNKAIWSTEDERVLVTEEDGFNIALTAKVHGDPDIVYSVLTEPDTTGIFRSIKACLRRHTVKDDGRGHRQLEVSHRAVTKFLFINVAFDTTLLVWEDDVDKKIHFKNANSNGFMKTFDGTWSVEPFTDRALKKFKANVQNTIEKEKQRKGQASVPEASSSTVDTKAGSSLTGGWFSDAGSMLQTFQHRVHLRKYSDTLATLEQRIVPRHVAPPGVKHLLKHLCAKQVSDMMTDLRSEVQRRERAGLPAIEDKGNAKGQKALLGGKTAAAAASLTLAQTTWAPLGDIWQHITPITIVVKL